ncbi:biotin-dependent carboxylase uncharacterized domain-containing protein [Atopomonas hussainii]|uniref:Biotin-dependent carboxylase uncharacterized domain-containing protein n=1 Tax=Atopomonas hussainii TaxID=1429083 RepID=A0A1H7QUA1_9GAMM|nr:biotin-dependent carboxyltransferase family protein [Atopomonas hussainii]SEL50877.1 biotin-dependent carboxylase uncharacterized domain-containing protein [Atopomonas hussainii]
MSALTVLKAGPLSLLMDGGRAAWQHLGVSASGPLDCLSAAWANRLLGNPVDAPLLEITLGGFSAEARQDGQLALVGAPLPAHIDGQPLATQSSFILRAGQTLSVGFGARGQRAYLAVADGFSAKPVLGSVATQTREGLGGLHGDGRALQAGDALHGGSRLLTRQVGVPWRFQPRCAGQIRLRLLPGGDLSRFTEAAQQAFFNQAWSLSADSNRMGMRLTGEALAEPPVLRYSRGMSLGAVQVPPSGQPVVLMADQQTMGGYPVLGWVHPLDLPLLAQLPPGGQVRFTSISLDDMQAEYRAHTAFFAR